MGDFETAATMTTADFTNQSALNFSSSTEVIITVDQRIKDILLEPLNLVLIVLSFIGLLANALSIVATLNIPHGQTTHSKLIINLAVSDICIILSVFINVLEKVLSPLHRTTDCIEVASQAFLNFALLAIILNLLAMGIDHYIAIMKPMHYHQIMSQFRGNMMIVFIWIISLIGGFLDIIVSSMMAGKDDQDFCSKVFRDEFQAMLIIFALILVEMLILSYIYLRIFCEVQLLLRRGATLQQDDMHNNKAIVTTLLIMGTFMICLAPNSVFQLTIYILVHKQILIPSAETAETFKIILHIHNALWILMLSNSLCDPIIYALRLRDVQRGYRRTLKKLKIKYRLLWDESRAPTRRYTFRTIVSESNTNEQHPDQHLATESQENLRNLTSVQTELSELKNVHPTTETDQLLTDQNKNCNISAEMNKQLNSCTLSHEDKHLDLTDSDNVSEMTVLTPASTTSDKPFPQNGHNEF